MMNAEGDVPEKGTITLVPPQIQQLLTEYKSIFAEPKGLPPPRLHDHKFLFYKVVSQLTRGVIEYPTFKKQKNRKESQEDAYKWYNTREQ